MRTKLIGLFILAAVIIAAAAYAMFTRKPEVTQINGYVGGEKIGLLEDTEITEILEKKYHLRMDYAKEQQDARQ